MTEENNNNQSLDNASPKNSEDGAKRHYPTVEKAVAAANEGIDKINNVLETVQNDANTISDHTKEVEKQATSIKNHETSASEAAKNAQTSATNALGSATTASESANAAAQSLEKVNTASVNAVRAEEAAKSSAESAKGSADTAKVSADSSVGDASTAKNQAQAASDQAAAATASATQAKNNSDSAAQHNTAAQASAETATASASDTKKSAATAEQSAKTSAAKSELANQSSASAAQELEKAQAARKQAEEQAAKAKAEAENAAKAHNLSTTVGLAGAFNEKSDAAIRKQWIWTGLLVISIIALGTIGWTRFSTITATIQAITQTQGSTLEKILAASGTELVLSILSLGAPIWVAWMSSTMISKYFHLAEDYSYKAALAKAYVGFRDEAKGLDRIFQERLFASAITQLDANPVRFMDKSYSHPGSPLQDLLQQPFMQSLLKDKTIRERIANWFEVRFKTPFPLPVMPTDISDIIKSEVPVENATKDGAAPNA